MALYSDMSGRVTNTCIALEEGGQTLCEDDRTASYDIRDHLIDSVWDLFIDNLFHGHCSCEYRLAEHLGIPEDEDNAAFARRMKKQAGCNVTERGDD